MGDPTTYHFDLDPALRPAHAPLEERWWPGIRDAALKASSARIYDPILGVRAVVIHATAGGSSAGAASVIFDRKASFHWLVPDEDEPQHGAFVWATCHEARAAWHVRNGCSHPAIWDGRGRINHWSLGIEVVKVQPGPVNTRFDERALEGLRERMGEEDYAELIDCAKNGPENTPGCDWVVPPGGACDGGVVGPDCPNAAGGDDGKDGGGYPSMGSVVSKFHGGNDPDMPGFVGLANSWTSDVYGAGEMGPTHEPVKGLKLTGKFALPKGIAASRLADRAGLRQEFDRFRRDLDQRNTLDRFDQNQGRAYQMVVSGKVQKAFDMSQEAATTRDAYGRCSVGEKVLLAR